MRDLLRRHHDERGITLVETMVTISLLTLVMGMVYGSFWSGMNRGVEQEERTRVQSETRLAMDSLVRDMRQAYTGDPNMAVVATMGASNVSFYSPDRSSPFKLRRIAYRVTGTTLERSVAASTNTNGPPWTFGSATPWVSVLGGVTGTLFTYRDMNGATTASSAAVRSIEITVTVERSPGRSPRPLSYRTIVNLRGTR